MKLSRNFIALLVVYFYSCTPQKEKLVYMELDSIPSKKDVVLYFDTPDSLFIEEPIFVDSTKFMLSDQETTTSVIITKEKMPLPEEPRQKE